MAVFFTFDNTVKGFFVLFCSCSHKSLENINTTIFSQSCFEYNNFCRASRFCETHERKESDLKLCEINIVQRERN